MCDEFEDFEDRKPEDVKIGAVLSSSEAPIEYQLLLLWIVGSNNLASTLEQAKERGVNLDWILKVI